VNVLAVVSVTVSIDHGPEFPSSVYILKPVKCAPFMPFVLKLIVTEFAVELTRLGAIGVPGRLEHRVFAAGDISPSPAALTPATFNQKYCCARFTPSKFVQSSGYAFAAADNDALGVDG
jgi:hypothetical protein